MTRRFVVVHTDRLGEVTTLSIVTYTDRADAERRVAERAAVAAEFGWPDRYHVAELVVAEPTDAVDGPNPHVSVAADLLIEHARFDITGCRCGWSELGKSHAVHVAKQLEAAGLLATGGTR